MSTSSKELLRSFDLLPDIEKREVASEIIRRTFSITREPALDDSQLKALYAGFAGEDRELAEEGIDDYNEGLALEDAQ